jgi:hypothetical protein
MPPPTTITAPTGFGCMGFTCSFLYCVHLIEMFDVKPAHKPDNFYQFHFDTALGPIIYIAEIILILKFTGSNLCPFTPAHFGCFQVAMMTVKAVPVTLLFSSVGFHQDVAFVRIDDFLGDR